MSSTALGAEKAIIFISDAHEKFYYEKLKVVRYQDVYHKALVYCLGISDDARRNIKSIYNFKTGCVKTECLHEGWQPLDCLKQHRKVTYTNILTSGRFNVYLADIDRQVQERIERRIEGMKQAQGNGAPKGRKHLRMDRTAQQYKGLCEGDCERGNYLCIVNQKRRG